MQPTAIAVQPAVQKDNLFGICHALGQEFGFDPLWLRLALAVSLLWNPVLVLAAYFYVGLVMLAARMLFPRRAAVPLVREAGPYAAPELARAA